MPHIIDPRSCRASSPGSTPASSPADASGARGNGPRAGPRAAATRRSPVCAKPAARATRVRGRVVLVDDDLERREPELARGPLGDEPHRAGRDAAAARLAGDPVADLAGAALAVDLHQRDAREQAVLARRRPASRSRRRRRARARRPRSRRARPRAGRGPGRASSAGSRGPGRRPSARRRPRPLRAQRDHAVAEGRIGVAQHAPQCAACQHHAPCSRRRRRVLALRRARSRGPRRSTGRSWPCCGARAAASSAAPAPAAPPAARVADRRRLPRGGGDRGEGRQRARARLAARRASR